MDLLPTQHELAVFVLGFAGGLTVMGGVWLIMDIRRVLTAPEKLLEAVVRGLNKPVKI